MSWGAAGTRDVDWNWTQGYSAFRFRYPKRFELAVWAASGLVALSMGRPTYEGHHLRLDFVEARPRELGTRPQVFQEILLAYQVYARLLGANQIRIMHPINETVRDYYRRFGYTYIAKKDYLFKEVV